MLFLDLILTGISGYDETIYPVDFRYNGHIVDDDMHGIMLAPLSPSKYRGAELSLTIHVGLHRSKLE